MFSCFNAFLVNWGSVLTDQKFELSGKAGNQKLSNCLPKYFLISPLNLILFKKIKWHTDCKDKEHVILGKIKILSKILFQANKEWKFNNWYLIFLSFSTNLEGHQSLESRIKK